MSHTMMQLPDVFTNSVACIDRATDACTAAGGVGNGPGICSADACSDVPPPNASCAEICWAGFLQCLAGSSTTYCVPFCQVDYGQCLDGCPG